MSTTSGADHQRLHFLTSHLRPERRIAGHSGRRWEIYVYGTRLPRFALPDLGGGDPVWDYGFGGPILWLLMEAPLFLVRLAIGIALFVVSLLAAAITGLRSKDVYVEAVDFSGATPEAFVWQTTRLNQNDVIEQVSTALQLGQHPRPDHAVLHNARP